MDTPPVLNMQKRPDLKQMGIGGAIVAALMVISPIKDFFYTREEGTALSRAVDEIKQTVIAESKETTRVMERKTDKIIDRMKEAEERTQRIMDRDNDVQNQRIQNLEATVLRGSKKLVN